MGVREGNSVILFVNDLKNLSFYASSPSKSWLQKQRYKKQQLLKQNNLKQFGCDLIIVRLVSFQMKKQSRGVTNKTHKQDERNTKGRGTNADRVDCWLGGTSRHHPMMVTIIHLSAAAKPLVGPPGYCGLLVGWNHCYTTSLHMQK